jgi:hypothetical protein
LTNRRYGGDQPPESVRDHAVESGWPAITMRRALLALIPLAVFVAARVAGVTWDPPFLDYSLSPMYDFGVYAHNARSWALFGTWTQTEFFTLPFFPGHVLPLACWFRIVGVSFCSLRYYALFCQALALVLTAVAATRALSYRAGLHVLWLGALSWSAFASSQAGWMENSLLPVTALALVVAARGGITSGPACLLGALAGWAVAAKMTMITIPVVAVIAMGCARVSQRRRIGYGALGLAIVVGAWLVLIRHSLLTRPEAFQETWFEFFRSSRVNPGAGVLERVIQGWNGLLSPLFVRDPVTAGLAFAGCIVAPWRREERAVRTLVVSVIGGVLLVPVLTLLAPLRYAVPLLPILWFLAARSLHLGSAELEARRSKRAFLGAAVAHIIFGILSSLTGDGPASAGLGAWAITVIAGAGLGAMIPIRLPVRRVAVAAAYCACAAITMAQGAQYARHADSSLYTASRALGRIPNGTVYGWIAPALSLDGRHRVLRNFRKDRDTPEDFLRAHREAGADQWWRYEEASAPIALPLIADVEVRVPVTRRVRVYRLMESGRRPPQ